MNFQKMLHGLVFGFILVLGFWIGSIGPLTAEYQLGTGIGTLVSVLFFAFFLQWRDNLKEKSEGKKASGATKKLFAAFGALLIFFALIASAGPINNLW